MTLLLTDTELVAKLRTLIDIDLTAARLLDCAAVKVEQGWTAGANARDGLGEPVQPHDPNARCWCAHGAINAAAHRIGVTCHDEAGQLLFAEEESGIVLDRARLAVRLAIERPAASMLAMSGLSLAKWNDKPTRTAGAVAAKLRAGAAKLRLTIERAQRRIAEIEAASCGGGLV
ncbi:MAG: hypothetical protein OXJ62_00420 [Spirochaetaceae bacterium]|nr:hypothetical protein [Spirochaetaceae bacterium]